jgi:hypothetical protein
VARRDEDGLVDTFRGHSCRGEKGEGEGGVGIGLVEGENGAVRSGAVPLADVGSIQRGWVVVGVGIARGCREGKGRSRRLLEPRRKVHGREGYR